MSSRGRRPGDLSGVMMLLFQMQQLGFSKIPPVTLVTVAVQAFLHMGVISPPWSKADVAISYHAVVQKHDYRTLFFSSFEHGDDIHLYYNMISFIMKGIYLENLFGSLKFAAIILTFPIYTNAMYISLAKIGSDMMQDGYLLYQQAIGFSAVIFALKVLATHFNDPERENNVMGISMPSKYVVWFELVLIHVMVPNASFIGHLAGIIVGILFVNTPMDAIYDGMFGTPRDSGTASPRASWSAPSFRSTSNRDYEYNEAVRRSLETFRNERRGTPFYHPSAPPYHSVYG